MELHGQNLIAGSPSAEAPARVGAVDPATGAPLPTRFAEATGPEVDRAMVAAATAFEHLRRLPGREIAAFLDRVVAALEAAGDALVREAQRETGLPAARLQGERGRMLNQARVFAAMAREGSWTGPRIDRADPARQPLPKPDVRSMLTGLGPVVVFGASNFPLAISVAGTDTLSALAAGCPVVVKAHPAHPGTSELAGRAIAEAVAASNLPGGTFSLVHGAGHEVGLGLVRHPAAKAVAFTGSFRGGKALLDAAAARREPIPVYAEMGSINPVILLPGALADRAPAIAAAYLQSVNMGVGQFCTNPGLVLGVEGPGLDAFLGAAGDGARAIAPATMLHAGIRDAYAAGVARIEGTPGVTTVGRSSEAPDTARTQAACALFSTTPGAGEMHPHLLHEVFGPASLIVRCRSRAELETFIRGLDGHLTASVHGTAADLAAYADLIALLETKVGRIVWNGFGTGIEVCAAMHHGGPYPATTDAHFTSIGHASIFRFARPICYQNFPDEALPEPLRNANPGGLARLVDGRLTTDAIA
jgi:NADP-dependent aldehyde dehydrogenase